MKLVLQMVIGLNLMEEKMGEDAGQDYFASLCTMAESLEEELAELMPIRDYCQRCERPIGVCFCSALPDTLILQKNVKIWVFQHPYEEKRTLRTTRILEKILTPANFQILKGRKFHTVRRPELKEVYENPNTVVLYPSETAITLDQYRDIIDTKPTEPTKEGSSSSQTDNRMFHVILIDGTWDQASGIYHTNYDLHKLKQIRIDADFSSHYTIRTQPRECFLSTLETVAIILSTLENKPEIQTNLIRPLTALCDFQIAHGCDTHHSKEYLILHGQYTKPISKRNIRQLTKNTQIVLSKESLEEGFAKET